MPLCHTGRSAVLKAVIGSFAASVIVLAGCNSEGTAEASKTTKAELSTKISELEAQKVPTRGGTPRSIKGKLFKSDPGENK
jgi:hypothetical protein